jgi:hypothetical protein
VVGDIPTPWLVGCLGVETRLAPCRKLKCATFVKRVCEAATPEKVGWCGPYPLASYYTLAFALQGRKYHGKNSVRASESSRLVSDEYDSFSRLGRLLSMTSTALTAPAVLGFRVAWQGQPSVSVNICRFAELGGSPS